MPKLIKCANAGASIIDDQWRLVTGDDTAHDSDQLLLPLKRWLELDAPDRNAGNRAPWIDSEEEFTDALPDLLAAPLIAVNFPTFMDGRGFSSAEILRRAGFKGELRAIGYLIHDQLFFLKRCGFNAMQLREGTDLEAALATLKDFSNVYQTSADTELPLFRRRG
jgi:uncharacterized protein (DUF934 family)